MSNLVRFQSPLVSWHEQLAQRMSESAATARTQATAAGENLRAGGEALLVGGLLGIVHNVSPTGLDIKKVPVDGLVGGLSLALGIALAHKEGGRDLSNAGIVSLGIMSFRKGHDLVATIRGKKNASGKPSLISKTGSAFGADEPPSRGWRSNIMASMGAESEDPVVSLSRKL